MKILTFTNLYPNRANPNLGIFVHQRIRHLVRNGISVEVVVPIPTFPAPGRLFYSEFDGLPSEDVWDGITAHYVRYPMLPGISMPIHARLVDFGTRRKVEQLHKIHGFDVIDAHYLYPDCVAAMSIGERLGLPVVMSARGSDVHQFFAMPNIKAKIHGALRKAKQVIAVSESLAQPIRALSGMPPVTVIGNGVDKDRFFPADRVVARTKLGIAHTAKVAVCVAALKPVKGIDLLLQAIANCEKQKQPDVLLLIGKGPEESRLRALADSLGLGRTVRFEGAVPNDQLRMYFSAADVSCLPSRNEGWPNVLLESLACGTPIVATKVGAAPEILHSSELGILADVDASSIGRALQEAFSREWDRELISRSAQSQTWHAVADRVISVLTAAISANDTKK